MKFSIITPSYNQGLYIERTLQSVFSQQSDVATLEYLVQDGGSSDDTLAILARYAPCLRFESAKDAGQADAVNKGFRQATGDIIGWLNSDDVYYPGAFKKVAAYFAAHPEVDVVYGDAYHIDQQDNVIEKYPTEPWQLQRFKETCYIAQPAVFLRRRVLEQNGYLDMSLHYCLDYDYWLRLALSGVRFGYLPEVLAGSRLYPETKTLSAPLTAQREALTMLRKRLGKVPLAWLITYAITLIKQKTTLRYPSVLFMLTAWWFATYQALCWNGFWHGMQSFFAIPAVMWAIKQKNKGDRHARHDLVSRGSSVTR